MPPAPAPRTSIAEFRAQLQRSRRVLALCGAGLSAASGLPTFRGGTGGLWRRHDPAALATPEAFAADPSLVWLFYAWRKHRALAAKPNRGHYALAELARRMDGFLCLSQNVDDLHPRAGHPEAQLRLLHGSILDYKCFDGCGYVERGNRDDPVCAALAPAASDAPDDPPLLDASTPVPEIAVADLPHCPRCRAPTEQQQQHGGLLRPGVVWFGEPLDQDMLLGIDDWIRDGGAGGPVDIMLVVGTSSAVYPAAGYTREARRRGAVVAVVNPEPGAAAGLRSKDFFFQGSAAEILPLLFEGVIGRMDAEGKIVEAGA
ncbi:DHS-like NAD/FAD-binding domain-containing protein [Xylariomycetidae sp. FL0641]|nr:DHS-like NAD/FAD-binding domain-containing protein [Xylariomycetidae sp. FL0641]